MFYSSYDYILPLNSTGNQQIHTYTSIFLKQAIKLPNNTDTASLVNSVLYALENDLADISEICSIIQAIISSQCTNTNSDFFGLFPYNIKLREDDYIRPDYDFQPLILLPLLECYINFGYLLPPQIMEQLSEALTLSTNIISYCSNLIDSHNKLLEIMQLICVGEHFSIPQFINSAINKATSYYHFIKYNGGMPLEYNSPDLIILQLEAISSFSGLIESKDISTVLNEIKDILLSVFYRHFNPHLFQWTGPFSLCNSKFLTTKLLERIRKVTSQKSLNEITIPDKFRSISLLYDKKFERLLVSKGLAFPHYKQCLVATTYNTKNFSLCSFNHDDLWVKRTPCIGYFGSRQAPYCLYLQCLLNGICFSSGAFHSIQHKEFLLGHINFSTNRGYKGLSLDQSNIYKTKDLRIRFLIEGDIKNLKISKKQNEICITYQKLFIAFNSIFSVFDNNKITYECTEQDNVLYFDIILYSGMEIDLELEKINNAIVAFTLYMGEKKNIDFSTKVYEDKKFLYSKALVDDLEIKLKSQKKPDNYEVIFFQDGQYISDTPIAIHVDNTETFTKHHEFFFENNTDIKQVFLKEKNIHNKKILKRISGLCKSSLNDVTLELKKLFNALDSFSVIEIKHYSFLILHQLYALARQTDRRFIRLIERDYSNVYQQLNISSSKKQIKKIIVNTASHLNSDYQHLQTENLTNTNKIIEDIIATMHSEFANPDLSLQSIAAKHDISESYISRKFTEYMGVSYIKYLTQLRINKAIELLSNNLDTKDIHIKCGYYNVKTFNTAFKKNTGYTAKNYIKRMQKTPEHTY